MESDTEKANCEYRGCDGDHHSEEGKKWFFVIVFDKSQSVTNSNCDLIFSITIDRTCKKLSKRKCFDV